MGAFLAEQVGDASPREVVGPLVAGGGASGVAVHGGVTVATWGAVDRPEMCFGGPGDRGTTWQHLLQQTSGWEGELCGKPSWADAQSLRDGGVATRTEPGAAWAYNDVLDARCPWCPAARTGAAGSGRPRVTWPGSACCTCAAAGGATGSC
jgi:hypothetical protein